MRICVECGVFGEEMSPECKACGERLGEVDLRRDNDGVVHVGV